MRFHPRLPTRPALAAALFLIVISPLSQAQTVAQLDRLVFTPTLLPEGGEAPLSTGESAFSPESLGSAQGVDPYAPPAALETTALQRHLEAVVELELEDGPYSPELFEALYSLGLAHQQRGEHEEAIEVLARAEHISHVNSGLFNEDLMALVESQIASQIALGRLEDAKDRQEYLVYLAERFYGAGDLRTVPAQTRLAGWNYQQFQRQVRFEAEGLLMLNSHFGTEKAAREEGFLSLFEAQRGYLKSIRTLTVNGAWEDRRLYDMERRLIESYYLQALHDDILADPLRFILHADLDEVRYDKRKESNRNLAFNLGVDAYNRMMDYVEKSPTGNLKDYLDAHLGLGDWYLLFGKQALGFRQYREAYTVMKSFGVTQGRIEALLNPAMPLVVPTFTPTPYTPASQGLADDAGLEYRGWVDVHFRLNRNGHARNARVLGKSPGTPRPVEVRLLLMLQDTQFRPRLKEGVPVQGDGTSLRYFYTY